MNWKDESGRIGTVSIIGRTQKARQRLGIRLKLENNMMKVGTEALEQTTNPGIGIGRFLTQKIVRP
jgi:hypothetical protein